jgi:hypothetical protein
MSLNPHHVALGKSISSARAVRYRKLALASKPTRTCFLSSQMNAIGGFSARLNGFRRGHASKMSSRQKQETPRYGLSGTHRTQVLHQNTNLDRNWTSEGNPFDCATG